ncbi:hypothetical protein PTTG_31170, partial [Puccinia triticina 1-1 BBBD Race 1]
NSATDTDFSDSARRLNCNARFEQLEIMSETIQHADGRIELQPEALESIKREPLYNEDLAPVPIEKRNWTTYNYAALWISMAHCIPTYMMASGLIAAG